jgi:hypothetical protein
MGSENTGQAAAAQEKYERIRIRGYMFLRGLAPNLPY